MKKKEANSKSNYRQASANQYFDLNIILTKCLHIFPRVTLRQIDRQVKTNTNKMKKKKRTKKNKKKAKKHIT